MFRVEFGIFFGFISKVFNATENKRAYRENKLHLDLSLKKFELYEYAISTKTLINFFISKKKIFKFVINYCISEKSRKSFYRNARKRKFHNFYFFLLLIKKDSILSNTVVTIIIL